jgi:hypothetical protein
MGLFDEEKSLSREELAEKLKRDKGIIPETGGKRFYGKEREKLSRETFSSKYGDQISKEDFKSAIRDLERQKRDAETREEAEEIDQKIRYLENQM